MRMKTFLAFIAYLFLLSSLPLFAQQMAPGIKWQKSLGGSLNDEFTLFDKLGNGVFRKISLDDHDGYLIAGEATSNNGDIVGSHGLHDIWVSKLDSSRNIIWSISLGGTDDEILGSVKQDNDGGYLVVGETHSKNGDIDSMQINNGLGWIVKLSHEGKIVWTKTFGNKLDDSFLGDVQVLGNEGYIVVGYTRDPQISGTNRNGDLWVLKLDRSGNLIWQKGYGGLGSDADGCNIKVTRDSGFIIAGITNSADKDVTGFHRGSGLQNDIWVVKLTAMGVIEWTRCLGGTENEFPGDIQITNDGGYIVVGNTNSKDGDVTELKGNYDAWAVKLTSSGQIQWQKTFGGSGSETLTSVIVMPDKSYVGIGFTSSFDGDVKFNHGSIDYWLINFNDSGRVIWETTYGGSGDDLAIAVHSLPNNEFIVLGESNSNDQQVSGNHGGTDLWLIKVGSSNTISGYTFYDTNKNGTKDLDEPFIDQVKVSSDKPGNSTSSISLNGIYRNDVDTGTFVTRAIAPLNYYVVVPESITSSFSDVLQSTVANFALQPISGKRDVTVNMISVNSLTRPGADITYNIIYKNVGTEIIAAGTVKLVKDHRIAFVSSTPAQTLIVNDTINWNYSSLKPLESRSINIQLQVDIPPVVNNLDTLTSTASIEQGGDDLTPLDNTTTLKQVVRGSFDPNDKSESHSGSVSRIQVANGEYFNYIIRFQNTGNDTAFVVSVRDTLDSKLDWNTFQMITSSHSYQLSLKDDNKLTWDFNGIQLPDSNINENASHGYIAYRIKPKSSILVGDIVNNSASIYFDYNLPVQTNTVQTKVNDLFVLPTKLTNFTAILSNNKTVRLNWKTASEINLRFYEIEKSYDGYNFNDIIRITGKNSPFGAIYSIDDSSMLKANNYYRLRIIDIDGLTTYSSVVLVKTEENVGVGLTVYPNPAVNIINIGVKAEIKGTVIISLIDMSGKTVLTKNLGYINANNVNSTIAVSRLNKGMYNVKVELNSKTLNQKLIIQ